MSDNKDSKNSSTWGFILSIFIHAFVAFVVIAFGVSGGRAPDLEDAIEVTLASLKFDNPIPKETKNEPKSKKQEKKEVPELKKEVKKPEPKPKPKPKKEEKKPEEIKKVEVKKKEPPKKEIIKKEIKKPEEKVITLETVKVEKKQKPEKKVVKKVEKPKPKKIVKEPKKSQSDVAREQVITDLKRKSVIDDLKKTKTAKVEKKPKSKSTSKSKKVTKSSKAARSSGTSKSTKVAKANTKKPNPVILNLYKQTLSTSIKQKYKIPPNLPKDGSLKAKVYFKMDGKGNVSSVKIQQSSGNLSFDNFCVNAVYSSAPFPPPPLELVRLIEKEGFIIDMDNAG